MITIYHNPRCSKSRQTLQILEESGQEFDVVKYLETPPSAEVVKAAFNAFGEKALRKGEQAFKDELKGKELTADMVANTVLAHPIVLERPLVVNGDKIALGRPPEAVKDIL